MRDGSPLRIKSLGKALRVLEAFGEGSRYKSLSDLAHATGIEKSAVQRIAYTLRDNGYLEQDPDTRQFCIGLRTIDFSFQYLRTHPLVNRATPALIDLRRSVRERVDMSLIDGTSLVYVVRLQSKRETFYATLVGRRVPVFCTAGGRAILSRMSEADALAIISASEKVALTEQTITDPDVIMREVQSARTRGYSVQMEEILPGEITVASAVSDGDGVPVAAIHVTALMSEWPKDDFVKNVAPLLTSAAHALSQ